MIISVCCTRILLFKQLLKPPDPNRHCHCGEGLRWKVGRDAREGEGKGFLLNWNWEKEKEKVVFQIQIDIWVFTNNINVFKLENNGEIWKCSCFCINNNYFPKRTPNEVGTLWHVSWVALICLSCMSYRSCLSCVEFRLFCFLLSVMLSVMYIAFWVTILLGWVKKTRRGAWHCNAL